MDKKQKPQERFDLKQHIFSITTIIVSTLIVTYFHYGVPRHHTVVHISHYYAFYIIVIYASYRYRLAGGLIVSVILTIIYSPSAYTHIINLDFPHHIMPSIIEVSMVYAVAIIAGILSGRLRREKQKVEQVSREMLEFERKAAHDNRLKEIGQLSAGIAHEIRNPLAAIKSGISLIKSGKGNDQVLDILSDEINNLNEFIERFLQYSRFGSDEHTEFELSHFHAELSELIKLAARKLNVKLSYSTDDLEGIVITGDKNALKQAVFNIILNGIEVVKDQSGAIVNLEVKVTDTEVIFNITDNGTGVSEDKIDSIFEPFFTTKENGTGLGLALAAKIARQHGGDITINNNDIGCTFTLKISR